MKPMCNIKFCTQFLARDLSEIANLSNFILDLKTVSTSIPRTNQSLENFIFDLKTVTTSIPRTNQLIHFYLTLEIDIQHVNYSNIVKQSFIDKAWFPVSIPLLLTIVYKQLIYV